MSETVRTPRQKRSIDTKNRIVVAGYKLFAEKGYYSTNTAEIAKEAGVSTGIVYGYFRDKRDILVEVMDLYVDNVFNPVLALFDHVTPPLDLEKLISDAVDYVEKMHRENAAMHEALHSLSHTDEAVRLKFISLEDALTEKLVERLSACGIGRGDLHEKAHLAVQIVQTYAHECVYDKHEYILYPRLRVLVVNVLKTLFDNPS